jgi:hypothetical protein
VVSPVPETSQDMGMRYRRRSEEWIGNWIQGVNRERGTDDVIVPEEILHIIRYQERVALSDQLLADQAVIQSYRPICDWLMRFLPTPSEAKSPVQLADVRSLVLDELSFSAGTSESQDNFRAGFVVTDVIEKALNDRTALVLGRKGTGKTAVFRWLAEEDTAGALVITSPSDLRSRFPWVVGADGFAAGESALSERRIGWREFWLAYVTLAAYLGLGGRQGRAYPTDSSLVTVVDSIGPISELAMIKAISGLLSLESAALRIDDWLQQIDTSLETGRVLLWDGLDTGFGNRDEERQRRRRAVEGLFEFYQSHAVRLKHLRSKILLREDIWKQLQFQNKSHLFGLTVRLEWKAQADYFRTVLKQAVQSEQFKKLVERVVRRPGEKVDEWPEETIFAGWDLLVGERMKGGKTAFTRNWVWNRLADANGDHTPRSLLQLFRVSSEKERQIASLQATRYERSLIRPRSLTGALDSVSEEATAAVQEEFPELSDVIERLRRIGRTPVGAEELQGASGLSLASEVGLIGTYDKGIDGEVSRYKVPDLYRIALGLSRKGQA